jgi:hypothetical protein
LQASVNESQNPPLKNVNLMMLNMLQTMQKNHEASEQWKINILEQQRKDMEMHLEQQWEDMDQTMEQQWKKIHADYNKPSPSKKSSSI